MSRCRALTVATYLVTIAGSAAVAGAAVAQGAWPAPSQAQPPQAQEQAPAGAWPAPNASQPAASGAWPAPKSAPAPTPQQSFIPPSPGFGLPQQQQEPPCLKDFVALRDEAGKKRGAIEQASKKKVPPAVACRLFGDYAASEVKLIKFVTANTDKCGMPKELLDTLTKGHAQTTQIRTRVCEVAAAGPPKPAGPRLSDVLSTPVPDSSNVKTGRGTFDTLSGSPLAR